MCGKRHLVFVAYGMPNVQIAFRQHCLIGFIFVSGAIHSHAQVNRSARELAIERASKFYTTYLSPLQSKAPLSFGELRRLPDNRESEVTWSLVMQSRDAKDSILTKTVTYFFDKRMNVRRADWFSKAGRSGH